MEHRTAAAFAVAVLMATALPACGGPEVSAVEARHILVSGLIDAGQPPAVAACIATRALTRHAPGELANTAGTTSAEVNASVAAIAAECTAELTPPPPPTTTTPATTPATTTPRTTAPATTTPPSTTPATTMPVTSAPVITVAVPPVAVNDPAARITASVPADWSGHSSGIAPTPFGLATRFLVRAPDPARFDEIRVDGLGVGIYALDGTVDYPAMLAASAPARRCSLVTETSYDDGVYVGVRREYRECDGAPAAIVVVGATDAIARVAVYVEIRAAALDDPAIATVLNSFYV